MTIPKGRKEGNRYRDFFSETETFFPRPNFPKPKPILFIRDQIFRNRNRDVFSETKFSEIETFFPKPNSLKPKPLKKLTKVSKPRSFETEISISEAPPPPRLPPPPRPPHPCCRQGPPTAVLQSRLLPSSSSSPRFILARQAHCFPPNRVSYGVCPVPL